MQRKLNILVDLKKNVSNNKVIIGILVLILTCGTATAALVISTGDAGITDSTRLEFANATELDKYNVAYNLVNQIPDPAGPGNYVELR